MTGDPVTWNYRIRSATIHSGVPGVEPQEQFDVIEVYYDRAGLPTAWCAATPGGDTLKDLYSVLTMMVDACGKPIINEDDLPGATK